MSSDPLDYQLLIQNALRDVVRRSLEIVAEQGLPGQHHLYITFRTDEPGVVISDELKARYPDEMSIVLEHQFRHLEVVGDRFTVELSFGGIWEQVAVPFVSVTAFVDPSASFALRFDAEDDELGAESEEVASEEVAGEKDPAGVAESDDEDAGEDRVEPVAATEDASGRVLSFDEFRKR